MGIKIIRGGVESDSEWGDVLLTSILSLLSWGILPFMGIIFIIDFFKMKEYKTIFRKRNFLKPPDWL